ncbi:MAG: hypothetical protein AAGA20_00570 [Planctomycetota bacterium]
MQFRTLALVLVPLLSAPSLAQRGAEPDRLIPPSDDVTSVRARPALAPSAATPRGASLAAGQRPVVLLTGYWPPTNEAVRRFSTDPAKNPQGWVGSDWMGRGYDVVSYFPEFNNPNCFSCGTGFGDLIVDYQDTLVDFDQITDLHKPIAIITFSRGSIGITWEVERNQFNRANWVNDFVSPRQPNPAPPDASLPAEALRLTALPTQRIVDAVAAAVPGVQPFICESGSGGGFLSEYIAFLGVWYQARNADPLAPDWCVTAGHVHVGTNVSWPVASDAVDVTLATVLDHVEEILSCPPMLTYCDAVPNSTNAGGSLTARGWPSISDDTIELLVQRVPANTSGLPFYGPSRAMGTIGNGTLCVGGPLTRLPVAVADARGAMEIPLDLAAPPLGVGGNAVSAGTTWSFQAWFRDVGVGVGSNATNALEITFCP